MIHLTAVVIKDGEQLFNVNELTWFHFSLLTRLFFRSHRLVITVLTVYLSEWGRVLKACQSYAEFRTLSSNFSQWETGKHSNRFHKKKQEKKTPFHFVRSSSFLFLFSQSVTLGLPSIHVNLMSRWIYTLSTVVLSKCTHNHEVEAMYLPWTTVISWPLARSFENEELRIVHFMIHWYTTLYWKRDWTNEQMIWMILPAKLTDGNWISTSNDEIHLWQLLLLLWRYTWGWIAVSLSLLHFTLQYLTLL